MKKIISNSICLLLIATGVWQCTPSEYNLVDYKEIDYIGEKTRHNKHVHYYYIDGILNAKTDVRWSIWNSSPDSIYTEYEIKIYDDRIDSIETFQTYMNDTLRYTEKTIKTYSLDGVIKKTVNYSLSDTGWVETGYTTYNASGQKTEIVGYGMYHYWYSYDSLGQYIGYRYRYLGTDSYLSIDTVIFSNDRLSAVETTTQWYDGNSIPRTTSKALYKLDRQGRIIQKENVKPDETDSLFYGRVLITARYNRRGQLVSKTTSSKAYEETDYSFTWKTEYRYHHGLKTWELYYEYDDGRWQLYRIYRYKYDFRHKLPLERTLRHEYYTVSANNLLRFIAIMTERVDERLVWTYEK